MPLFSQCFSVGSTIIIDSLYFCTVTMSTVGYGDLTPSTPGTKAFTALWIFVGVTIIFTQIYACFGSLIVPITRRGRDILEIGVARAFPRTFVDIDGDGEADFLVPRHWFLAYSQGMLPTIMLNWCMQVFFAMVFVAIEGWNFGDAFWHFWATARRSSSTTGRRTNFGRRWLMGPRRYAFRLPLG